MGVVQGRVGRPSGSMTTKELTADLMRAKALQTGDRVLERALGQKLVNSLIKRELRRELVCEGKQKGVSVWRLSTPVVWFELRAGPFDLDQSFELPMVSVDDMSPRPKPPKPCLVCSVAMQSQITKKGLVHCCQQCGLIITIAPKPDKDR